MQKAGIILAIWTVSVLGQTPNRPASSERQMTAEATIALPSQKIGPGDLISISVADCPEMSRNFRVSSDGLLTLPLLQEKIRAAGKEPDEIEGEVAEALVRDEILVRPVVSAGSVKKPVTFQAVGYTTLLDAITKAEGLAPDAGAEILVTRPHVAGSAEPNLVQRIPVKGLIDDADPALNVRLYGGEEVRVPPAGRVYVLGNVKKSGSFPVTDNNDATVMKVIAMSEGLLPFSAKQAYIYRREAGKTGRDEISVDLNEIMRRKSPDVQLQANDILYIPDNHGRKMTAAALERITSFGSSTASGLLIWH